MTGMRAAPTMRRMASPELKHIVAMLRAIPRRETPSVASMRRGFESMTRLFPTAPDVTITPVDLGGVPGEHVGTPGTEPTRAILYLHGGGFVMGSPATHRDLVARLTRVAGASAFVPDYRLAPEHPFPRGFQDCVAAYRALLARGLAPERIAVVGDSAGGGLTMSLLLSLRDAGIPLPAAAACMSPWVDLTMSGASIELRGEMDPWIPKEGLGLTAQHYLAGADPTDPLASPMLADLARLPPLLIQVGTAEILYDDAARLAERARASGVAVTFEPWEEMIHVWQAFPMLPEAHEAVLRIGRFVREHTGG
ncbi:6-hexanolactone hydrolase [Minicystis rosea]|nr:6-hexanolactone hydrolase [Minicystis rosea]